MPKAANFIPKGFHTITPQLTADNAGQTMEWYKKVLSGAEVERRANEHFAKTAAASR